MNLRYALTFTTPKATAMQAQADAAMYTESINDAGIIDSATTRLRGQFACVTVRFESACQRDAEDLAVVVVTQMRRSALQIDAWKVHNA